MAKTVKVCFLLTLILLFPVVASAQFANDFLVPELSLVLNPSFPKPGEPVRVSLNNTSSDTFGSSITWVLNGEEIAAAENQRSIVLTAGDLGETDELQAILNRPDGNRDMVTATIKPIWFDIIIEPQTFTPYGYTGRAVPSVGSVVNATALITDGSPIGGDNYIYTWEVDQNIVQGGPLRGAEKITFTMPMGNSTVLAVEVFDLSGNLVASRAIRVPSVAPHVSFYNVSTLYGLSKRALDAGATPIIGNNTTLRAVPYFLDTRVYNDPAISEWMINGRVVDNGVANPYVITLQGILNNSTADISFHVRDTTQVLQGVRETITVNN